MQLTMTVLRCPDAVAPETRNVTGGEFSVGRGPGVDWVLPDPERLLSKRHFAVAFRGGAWQLADTSTNGTFLNREGDPHRRRRRAQPARRRPAARRRLRDRGAAGGGGGGAPCAARRRAASPFADPFAMDPFAPARPERNPFDEPDHPSLRIPPTSAQLPHDFDPLAPEPHETPFRGPTQADHSPAMQDAFQPPAQIGQMPLHTGGVIPGDDLLPDDWDKDLLEGIAAGGNAGSRDRPRPNGAAPVPPPRPRAQGRTFDAPPAAPPPTPRPPRAGSRSRSECRRRRALLAAFLEGAGMQDARPEDPPATMLASGQGVPQHGRRTARRADRARPDQERIPHRADDDPGARQQPAEILRRRR